MAKEPRRIDLSLFDDDLKTLINAAAKIFPVNYSYVTDNINPNNYEWVRVIDGDHRKEIYHWENGVFELIGADDKEVDFEIDVVNKPISYPPGPHVHESEHTHSNKSLLDSITQLLIDAWNNAVTHISDAVKHITAQERIDWYDAADKVSDHETRLANIESGYSEGHTHANLSVLASITQVLVDAWNTVGSKADKTYVDTELAKKADSTTVTGHIGNSTIHVTQTDKDNWNSKTQIIQGTVKPATDTVFWFKEV